MLPIHWTQLWQWQGRLGRLPYALWGVLLLALKYNMDRAVSVFFFESSWSIFAYYAPFAELSTLQQLESSQWAFYSTLLVLALPFIAAGVGLTLQRLRSAALPLPLVVLFFVPFLNLLFFLLLCLWPEEETVSQHAATQTWQRYIPQSFWGSALAGVGISLVLALLMIAISVLGFQAYGIALFVGLPFVLGLCTTLIFTAHEERRLWDCIKVSLGSLVMLGLGILAVAMEGVICVLMATPLALVLTLLGTAVAWTLQTKRRHNATQGVLLMLFLPGFMGIEKAADFAPPRIEAVTTLDIAAPPEVVWEHVVRFSELPPPSHWILKTGIAYPIRAEIKGSGVGAIRHCVFSTGPFVEPIEVWNPPHHLKFSVSSQPAPMKELTPYRINPPHLDHFLRSEAGQFVLTPLPNGGTRLAGTTWYVHQIWPAPYWQLWSDAIIHSIHTEVLQHIKHLSEAPKA